MPEVNEFKSFFKTVGAGEGDRCFFPTRLDTYGRGCQHDCKYGYRQNGILPHEEGGGENGVLIETRDSDVGGISAADINAIIKNLF